jgi:hypothetical protein
MQCPKGSYREGTAAAGGNVACVKCPKGWTTASTGTTLKTSCSLLLPGYKAQDPSTPGVTVANVCERGTFSIGGGSDSTCTTCGGYTTKSTGSKSASECVAPPGYFLNGTSLDKCASGQYAAGWGRRTSCTSCGIDIPSDANTPDEHPTADAGDKIRGSASDCYILAGWGMVYNRGSNSYRATICAKNTYGLATKEYGLKSIPCTPCPRGLVTSSTGSTSDQNCTNLAGWGVSGQTAEICGPAFYAAAGSREPCTRCPPNRNTTATGDFDDTTLPAGTDGDAQDGIEDCKVVPGFGLVGYTPGSQSVSQLANFDTIECTIGSWSAGGIINSTCTACLGKRSTLGTASTSAADCDICLPGFGIRNTAGSFDATNCAGCAAGYYNNGDNENCTVCQDSTFEFAGKSDVVTSPPTSSPGNDTAAGAAGTDQCYPEYFQMDDSQGTHIKDVTGLTAAAPTNASDCAASCVADNCLAATWIYTNTDVLSNAGACYQIAVPTGGAATLAVKILPLDSLQGSSVDGAAAASGAYVTYSSAPTSSLLGAQIGATETVALGAQACKDACDADSSCVLVYFTGSDTCYLRQGLEAQSTRTFINVPAGKIDSDSF